MSLLGSTRVIAIVRFHEGGNVWGAIEALSRGGVSLAEVTLDTPGALAAIERAASAGRPIGAGTVTSAEQVRAAAAAGASFVVSPGLVSEVVAAAHDLGLEAMPGVFTPTELMAATSAGAHMVKLFPASVGGPAHVRALRGPFPDVPIVPTGGVRLDDVQQYLDAGAAAVGLGSELVGREAPHSDADLDAIVERARAVTA